VHRTFGRSEHRPARQASLRWDEAIPTIVEQVRGMGMLGRGPIQAANEQRMHCLRGMKPRGPGATVAPDALNR
jgi:hypothetical protein